MRTREPERRRRVRRAAALLAGLAAALATSAISAAGFDLAQLTAQLARVKSGEATFTEKRRVEMLDRTLESSGRLVFRAPDTFIRETLKPRREKLEVAGNVLTMSLGERSRTVQLDSAPEAAVIVEAVRGTLTGNRESLERLFDSQRLRQRRALVAGAGAARPAAARPGRLGAGQRPRADGARSPGAARRRRPLDDDDRAAARRCAMSRRRPGRCRGHAMSAR